MQVSIIAYLPVACLRAGGGKFVKNHGAAYYLPMDQDKELERLRKSIDDLDRELIDVLARRMKFVETIQRYKKGIVDPERHGEIMRTRPTWGSSRNLSGNFVRELFERILRYTEKKE